MPRSVFCAMSHFQDNLRMFALNFMDQISSISVQCSGNETCSHGSVSVSADTEKKSTSDLWPVWMIHFPRFCFVPDDLVSYT